jgi:hypothetical protein
LGTVTVLVSMAILLSKRVMVAFWIVI